MIDEIQRWLTLYFLDREQFLSTEKNNSFVKPDEYGVIQAGTLLPILFPINIIRLRSANQNIILFAHNAAIIYIGESWDETWTTA